jgi:hypothetical protein
MSSTFFTTDDGDVILRAGPEYPKQDFRVHKFILSLASPVFKDMFTFPQPPGQNHIEQPDIPIVDVPDPPKVLDAILRFIYPGVEPPKISALPILSALLSAADKYNMTSIYPVLRDILKTFLSDDPFGVYVVACRFGFPEEAKEAAKVSNAQSILSHGLEDEVRHISSIDVFRFARFVQEREYDGRSTIEDSLSQWYLGGGTNCNHWEDAQDFYSRLQKAVEDAFAFNPCVEHKDLLAILDRVPDPPPGCAPLPKASEFYEETFNCPLQPMSIRCGLEVVAMALRKLNQTMLDKAFGKGTGSG